jgi:4-amino-4-deoxy-L-arabinose transferase-like glycosyltransferase
MDPSARPADAETRPALLSEDRLAEYFTTVALILPVLLFLRVLFFDFVYDDEVQILANPWIHSFHNLPTFFTQPVWGFLHKPDIHGYYRPLFLVLLTVCYKLFGEEPLGWHAVNLILHVLTVAAVFWAGKLLLRDRLAASLGALLFAINPVHTEPISWISNLPEILFTFFVVLSFGAYLRAIENESSSRWWWFLSWTAAFLGLLSKETALCLPILIFLHAVLLPRSSSTSGFGRLKNALAHATPYLALSTSVFFARHYALRDTHAAGYAEIYGSLVHAPAAIVFYAWHLVFPFRLALFYSLPHFYSAMLGVALLWTMLFAILLGGVVFSLRRFSSALFLVFWIAITILPAIVALGSFGIYDAVHDRYLYLPSVGLSWLIALPVARRKAWCFPYQKVLFTVMGLALCVSWLLACLHENQFWRSNFTLYRRAAERSPDNVLALTSYGLQYDRQGQIAEAVVLLRKASALDPDYFSSWNGLGTVEAKLNHFPEARTAFAQADTLVPESQPAVHAQIALQLAEMELRARNPEAAILQLEKTLALAPDNPKAHMALAAAYALQGKVEDAGKEQQIANSLHSGAATKPQ